MADDKMEGWLSISKNSEGNWDEYHRGLKEG